jgi:hypothetical protein
MEMTMISRSSLMAKCLQIALFSLLFGGIVLAQVPVIRSPAPNAVFQSGGTILVTYTTTSQSAELNLLLITPDGNTLLSAAQGPTAVSGTQSLFVPPDFTGQAMVFLQDVNGATRANVTVNIVPWMQILAPMAGVKYVIDSDDRSLSIAVRAAGVEGTWDEVDRTHILPWSYTIPELGVASGPLVMPFLRDEGCFSGTDYLRLTNQNMEYAGQFRVVATVEGFAPATVSATFVKQNASYPPLPLGFW